MTSESLHDVVDLTDESDVSSSSSSFALHTHRPSYTSSLLNPAKRTRIDPADMTPMALLDPRAHVAKNIASGGGTPSPRNGVSQQGHAGRHTPDTPAQVSLNRRMESLHGLKDRKVRAPKPQDGHRETASGGLQDRRPGQSLLATHPASGSSTPDIIDLTCTHPHIRFMNCS